MVTLSTFHTLGRTNKYLFPEKNVCNASIVAFIKQSGWKEGKVAKVWAQDIKEPAFKLRPKLSWWCWTSHVASRVPWFPFCIAGLIASLSIKKEDSPVGLWFSLASLAERNNTLCFSLSVVIFGPSQGGKREMKAPSELCFLLLEQK